MAAVVVAVALWSTTTWALASPHASARHRPVASAQAVSVGIPSVVFGQADGLGAHLPPGAHDAVIAVWLAAGSPSAAAGVTAVGGRVRGCSHVPLRAAAVTTLRCTVVSDGSALTLLARTTVAGHPFTKAYVHR